MPNITITHIDRGAIVIEGGIWSDEPVTFASADTYLAGTIMARDSVSSALIPYVKGGTTNGDGIPKAVLTYEISADGAGTAHSRVCVKGRLNRQRLVIHADGDASNVDEVVLDELRSFGLVASEVAQLSQTDND